MAQPWRQEIVLQELGPYHRTGAFMGDDLFGFCGFPIRKALATAR